MKRKFTAVLMAIVVCFSMSVTAFAADELQTSSESQTITVSKGTSETSNEDFYSTIGFEVSWTGNMEWTITEQTVYAGQWNPETLKYDKVTERTSYSDEELRVTYSVANRSNIPVQVTVEFTPVDALDALSGSILANITNPSFEVAAVTGTAQDFTTVGAVGTPGSGTFTLECNGSEAALWEALEDGDEVGTITITVSPGTEPVLPDVTPEQARDWAREQNNLISDFYYNNGNDDVLLVSSAGEVPSGKRYVLEDELDELRDTMAALMTYTDIIINHGGDASHLKDDYYEAKAEVETFKNTKVYTKP